MGSASEPLPIAFPGCFQTACCSRFTTAMGSQAFSEDLCAQSCFLTLVKTWDLPVIPHFSLRVLWSQFIVCSGENACPLTQTGGVLAHNLP